MLDDVDHPDPRCDRSGRVFLAFFLVAHLLHDARPRSGSGEGTRDEGPPRTIELLRQRRAGVGQLSDAERTAIERDIHAAVGDLANRGLISEVEAERARGAKLGALDLHMRRRRASARDKGTVSALDQHDRDDPHRRDAALAVDVHGDLACTVFMHRYNSGELDQRIDVLTRRGGRWAAVGDHRSTANDDRLSDRPVAGLLAAWWS